MIEWREDGFFSYRSTDTSVYGCTQDAATLTEILKRAGVLRTTRSLFQVTTGIPDIGHDSAVHNEIANCCEKEFAAKLLPESIPQGLTDQLLAIGSKIPETDSDVQDYLSQRAAELNVWSPQAPSPSVFGGGEECYSLPGNLHLRGYGTWAAWIDPRLIVSTRDRVWNDIDRNPPRNSVHGIAAGLRDAAATGDVTNWLHRMYGHPGEMFIKRAEGPAGPIYETALGTHRTHAARLLELPAVLARIVPVTMPTPASPAGDGRWTHPSVDIELLWRGLMNRGVITAEVIDGHWHFGALSAEWMLASPEVATLVNAAYERLYPGALQQATGLTREQLTQPESWYGALTEGVFAAEKVVHTQRRRRRFWWRAR
ncbi:hypothetical protein ACM0CO_19250 [Mycobacteroides abscessus subsp. abscessus]|uniref:hypothetical protein n=1 Tax=Mycobacteroides abscessus TaxID=36809 RepID=UPI0039F0051A